MPAKILCVEDTPQNMRLVRKILSAAGYEVIEAEDGLAGLARAKEHKPTIILLDVNLPDIDGLEVARRLKGDDATKMIPLIALTANAMYGDRERCMEAGCNGYVPKPITKSELLNTVAHFIQQLESEAKSPEAQQPEIKPVEAKSVDAKSPETQQPEIKQPEAKLVDAKSPEAQQPEIKQAEAKLPEVKQPDPVETK